MYFQTFHPDFLHVTLHRSNNVSSHQEVAQQISSVRPREIDGAGRFGDVVMTCRAGWWTTVAGKPTASMLSMDM